jgi:hypothetical protein
MKTPTMKPSSGSYLYVGGVIAVGLALLVFGAPRSIVNPVMAAALLVSTIVLSIFKIRLPLGQHGVSTMSMAYAVDFVALIVEGANVAMVLAAIGVLIQCTVRVSRRQPIHRSAFSAAAVVIAVQLAGWGWRALGGSLAELTLTSTVLPLAVCAITYYIVNTSLVVGAIAVTSSTSPAKAWNPEFWWSAPAYLLAAVVAGLVAMAILNGVVVLLPIVASPLYVCYRGYHRRWSGMAQGMVERSAQAVASA